MRALNQKLLRDSWRMRGQLLAIVLVVVAGMATFVGMRGVMHALQETQASYYAEYRFADGFANVRRAPERVAQELRTVPGISDVETRVRASANVDIPGFDEPVTATIQSVPDGRTPRLNQLFIREGRMVQPGRDTEVLVNEVFAEAHRLQEGDTFTVTIRGQQQRLTVVGIALSPEFVIQVQPGGLFPDRERFGVLWMGRSALAAANDMAGAFNNVSFSLAPGASLDDVLARVDLILDRFGGTGAIGRADQPSHSLLAFEFEQLRGTSTVLPLVFLLVAAFLLNIVVARLVNLQREQIAMLKAFGYSDLEVGAHYMQLVLGVVTAGAVLGMAAGLWIGQAMGQLYLDFFRFPSLVYTFEWLVALTAFLLTAGASLAGVIGAVARAVRLPPAEAMRPAAPPTFKPTVIERIGLQRFFDQPTRMILRNLERQPIKSALTVTGMAAATAILVLGLFFTDAVDYLIEVQFEIIQREDLTVTFTEPTSPQALYEMASLEGVTYAEPFRAVPVRLHHEHRTQDISLEGIPPAPYLRRIVDTALQPIPIPEEGIVLSDRLARTLQVAPGDYIQVEVREGARRTHRVAVVGLAEQFIGVGAYMDFEALYRLTGEGPALSGVFLMTDADDAAALQQTILDRPRVAGVVSQDRAVEGFEETSAENLLAFTFILSLFAGVIAFGVIYNSARITLSERERELASLRVLGFTRAEISYILIGEMTLLTLLALPLGFALGAVGAAGVLAALETDLYQIPFALSRATFATAAAVVMASAVVSAIIIRRKLHRLDLIAVLKTRE